MAYDDELLAIGCGPAGQRAAIQTAKLGHRVAVVERPNRVGGVCTNTGTLPSKTLRAAALDLTGLLQKDMYGDAYRVKSEITVEDLFWRTRRVIDRETEVIRDQLSRNHVDLLTGSARFIDAHTLDLGAEGGNRRVTADKIVIAVGTTPVQPADVDFDGRSVLDSDSILQLERIPATMTVVGAGVIGIEYASVFAAIGVRVTVIERQARLLPFVDAEIIEALQYHLRELRVSLRFGETVVAVNRSEDGHILTQLASGKMIPSDAVLYAAGRQGATSGLELENAGLEADPRGRIAVSETYQTAQPHIYAVGDVVGFPSLASTSSQQGRQAACRRLRDRVPDDGVAAAVRDLHDPRDLDGRTQRGGADGRRGALRRRPRALPRDRTRADLRGHASGCSSCWSRRTAGRCSAFTSSAARRPSSCTWGRA